MFAFAVYAIAVWFGAYRWRRRVLGFALVVLGLAILGGVAWGHYQLNILSNGRLFLPLLQVLLYPYAALVFAGGVFLACMPPRRPGACDTCGYDLTGLYLESTRCPECGSASVSPLAPPGANPGVTAGSPPEDAEDDAKHEHTERKQDEQADADREDAAGTELSDERDRARLRALRHQAFLRRQPEHR